MQLLSRIYQLQYSTRVKQVYDIFWFGVDRVSSFLSVMQRVSTLESCLQRETAENHALINMKKNFIEYCFERQEYILQRQSKETATSSQWGQEISMWEKYQFRPLPSVCCMTLNMIFVSVLYPIFCLSCQVRLCAVQGRACMLFCDCEEPSTGSI